ncbi:MAG TPA: DUF2934 domain-containing protein [Terriglobales bacterium]|jgi:hypothetical protein|nr:DUF2934 domain-containing protein [Terriglobales bacterium]
MPQKEMKSELRNQTESQSDGFGDSAAAKAQPGNGSARTEDAVSDQAIRERAHQLYEESDRQDGNAEGHWYQAASATSKVNKGSGMRKALQSFSMAPTLGFLEPFSISKT